jgi:AraC-like DNA-binding protein
VGTSVFANNSFAACIIIKRDIMNEHATTARFSENSGRMNPIAQPLPVLLLVSDNIGKANYLADMLRTEFRIVQSCEVASACQLAQLHHPNIIVSDTILADGSGYDLCKRLHHNTSTATIPFVFVAAFASPDIELKGLQMGAIDVINLSVDAAIVRLRLKNIVAMTMRIRHQIHSETLPVVAANNAFVSADDRFLEKMVQIIDKHLDNPELDVALLSREAGLSSNNLYRKIKSLTQLSIPEFIRQRRIKISAVLLGKHNHFVQEVCYMVGFNSPSYFSRCFREQFGCSPKEYIDNPTTHQYRDIALKTLSPLQVVNW